MHKHRPSLMDLVNGAEAKDKEGAITRHCFCKNCGQLIRISPKAQGLYNVLRFFTYTAPLILIVVWDITKWANWYGRLILCLLIMALFFFVQYLYCRFAPFIPVPEDEYTGRDKQRIARRRARKSENDEKTPL